MKPLLLYIALLFSTGVNAQIITTFAGGGLGGDGGPATAAIVADPDGGSFDQYGNYYFTEATANIARKVSNVGIITTIAGSGSSGFSGDNGLATLATLSVPAAIILDAQGNLYIADANNMRVRKVNAVTGVITTIAGSSSTPGYGGDNGLATSATLFGPDGLCFDTSGNLYIADEQNYRIRKVDTSGIITTFAGIGIPGYLGDGGQASSARISLIAGLAIDDTGNIYISGGNVVRKINRSGIIITVAGVYGAYMYTGDGVPATNAPINAGKIAIDHLGQLVIGDEMNYRVYRVDLAGVIHTIAGNGMPGYSGDGVPATATSLDYPSGLSFDSCGNLYITEANNGRVRKVTFDTACSITVYPALNVANTNTSLDISIFPNPTNDILNMDNLATPSTYQLQNLMGATLQQGIVKQGNNSISVQSLPSGLYLFVLIDDEGKRLVRKFVKE